MNESGKSDKPVVPAKPANTSANPNYFEFFEQVKRVEGRGLAKENGDGVTDVVLPVGPAKQGDRTQCRVRGGSADPEALRSALDRVRQAACRDKQMKFTSLWHHVYNVDRLREAYLALKRDAAPGVDGETW